MTWNDITLNTLPGSYTGVVAYCSRTGKTSVADDGRSRHLSAHRALQGLNDSESGEGQSDADRD
jgi:hypothetical protein